MSSNRKFTRKQLRKLILESVSDIYKTTVTDPTVFEDPNAIMNQFHKLSDVMTTIHENVKLTYGKLESLEDRMKVVEEILEIQGT